MEALQQQYLRMILRAFYGYLSGKLQLSCQGRKMSRYQLMYSIWTQYVDRLSVLELHGQERKIAVAESPHSGQSKSTRLID